MSSTLLLLFLISLLFFFPPSSISSSSFAATLALPTTILTAVSPDLPSYSLASRQDLNQSGTGLSCSSAYAIDTRRPWFRSLGSFNNGSVVDGMQYMGAEISYAQIFNQNYSRYPIQLTVRVRGVSDAENDPNSANHIKRSPIQGLKFSMVFESNLPENQRCFGTSLFCSVRLELLMYRDKQQFGTDPPACIENGGNLWGLNVDNTTALIRTQTFVRPVSPLTNSPTSATWSLSSTMTSVTLGSFVQNKDYFYMWLRIIDDGQDNTTLNARNAKINALQLDLIQLDFTIPTPTPSYPIKESTYCTSIEAYSQRALVVNENLVIAKGQESPIFSCFYRTDPVNSSVSLPPSINFFSFMYTMVAQSKYNVSDGVTATGQLVISMANQTNVPRTFSETGVYSAYFPNKMTYLSQATHFCISTHSQEDLSQGDFFMTFYNPMDTGNEIQISYDITPSIALTESISQGVKYIVNYDFTSITSFEGRPTGMAPQAQKQVWIGITIPEAYTLSVLVLDINVELVMFDQEGISNTVCPEGGCIIQILGSGSCNSGFLLLASFQCPTMSCILDLTLTFTPQLLVSLRITNYIYLRLQNAQTDLYGFTTLSGQVLIPTQATPTPTPIPMQSPTPSPTASALPIPTPTPTESPTPTPTPTNSPTPVPQVPPANVCFPAKSTVRTQAGHIKTMDQLQIGDMVEIAKDVFSPIYFFSHRDPTPVNDFVKIETADQQTGSTSQPLLLTSSHYLYTDRGMKTAGSMKPGDLVITSDGSTKTVFRISIAQERGLYNPHTKEGVLIVNDLKTSCYTQALHPYLAQVLLTPIRWLYSWRLVQYFPGKYFDVDRSYLAAFMPKGKHSMI